MQVYYAIYPFFFLKKKYQVMKSTKINFKYILGMNSIVLYLGHQTAWKMGPFNYISGPMNTHFANLVESIWTVSAWLIVAYILYRKKVFITV